MGHIHKRYKYIFKIFYNYGVYKLIDKKQQKGKNKISKFIK